nr:MAG TPA: hypothetical protein [Caudoviricetes sp.]
MVEEPPAEGSSEGVAAACHVSATGGTGGAAVFFATVTVAVTPDSTPSRTSSSVCTASSVSDSFAANVTVALHFFGSESTIVQG